MCVAGEDEPSVSAAAVGGALGIPEIVVTAPSLDLDFYQSIDWSQVAHELSLGALSGIPGGFDSVVINATDATIQEIASQHLDFYQQHLVTPGAPGVYQQY